MNKVRIITDSTADLSPELRRAYEIAVVPLSVHFGSEELLDQVDITSEAFFDRLQQEERLPRTSQPSPARFIESYRRVAADDPQATILSLHVADSLSGTVQSAAVAAEAVKDEDIDVRVIDGNSASLGLGFQALAAAESARAGASVGQIVEKVRQVASTTSLYFSVDTLEYLEKNGRIGRASAYLGTLLKIKPLLALEDGQVEPVTRLRGRRQVHRRLLELATATTADLSQEAGLRLAVVHAAPRRARDLAADLREALPASEVIHAYISPVLGCHAGPGVLGIIYHPRLSGQPPLAATAGRDQKPAGRSRGGNGGPAGGRR